MTATKRQATAPTKPAESDVELAMLADDLLTAMALIRRSARRLVGRPAELAALTGSQIDLVRLVRRRPGISVTKAAEVLNLAANTVSTLVTQLTDAGLMIRRAGESDRRVARLELTVEMQRRVDSFRDRRVAALAAAMERLPAGERRRLVKTVAMLGEIANALPGSEPR